ncbi:hypothetical protein HK099_006232, partial [Clydaea vesicula]
MKSLVELCITVIQKNCPMNQLMKFVPVIPFYILPDLINFGTLKKDQLLHLENLVNDSTLLHTNLIWKNLYRNDFKKLVTTGLEIFKGKKKNEELLEDCGLADNEGKECNEEDDEGGDYWKTLYLRKEAERDENIRRARENCKLKYQNIQKKKIQKLDYTPKTCYKKSSYKPLTMFEKAKVDVSKSYIALSRTTSSVIPSNFKSSITSNDADSSSKKNKSATQSDAT